jgi:hypothetical protein
MLTMEVAIVEAAALIAGAHVVVRIIDFIDSQISGWWRKEHTQLMAEYNSLENQFSDELAQLKEKIAVLSGKKNV